MKLLLVSPSWFPALWNGGKVLAPPLSLPTLAALTPGEADIHLVDEHVEPVDLDEPADLVGISCMTAAAPRGYEIADHFRARGVPVVMGGMHPSALPDEAAEHADAVVIGEAENQWPQVIADFAAGRPQQFYRTAERPTLEGFPFPRRELLQTHRYLITNLVQTARGCPHQCKFCSVTPTFGRQYRFRSVAEVIEEVRSLRACWVAFPDDNIVANPARAKELFEALIPLKLRWVGQGDLAMARDEEMLRLMARSGCTWMFVGLESTSRASLAAANKRVNLALDLEESIKTVHRHGIDIVGSFVFGLDPDTPAGFRETTDFAARVGLGAAQFAVLTPFPGTVTHEELEREGRITSRDWSRYTQGHVVYQPRNMTAAELEQARQDAYRRFYSRQSILRRTLTSRGGLTKAILRAAVNNSYRRLYRGGRISGRMFGQSSTAAATRPAEA